MDVTFVAGTSDPEDTQMMGYRYSADEVNSKAVIVSMYAAFALPVQTGQVSAWMLNDSIQESKRDFVELFMRIRLRFMRFFRIITV